VSAEHVEMAIKSENTTLRTNHNSDAQTVVPVYSEEQINPMISTPRSGSGETKGTHGRPRHQYRLYLQSDNLRFDRKLSSSRIIVGG
jgi:hypothetical protein